MLGFQHLASSIALLAQGLVFAPQPEPPPPALPGSQVFAQELERERLSLQKACLSAQGIEIILKAFTDARLQGSGANQEWRSRELEVAQAAYAVPFEHNKFEAAVTARARFRSEREIGEAARRMSTYRQLAPADQAAYARGFTYLVPNGAEGRCR